MNVELEEYKKSLVRRARIQAMLYGIFSTIMLISVVFTFFQREVTEDTRKEIDRLKIELRSCQDLQKESEKRLSIQVINLEKAIQDAQLAKENAEQEYAKAVKKTK